MTATARGLLIGWVADELLGDPRRGHPVAGFGRVAAWAERTWWADDRGRGVRHVAALAGGTLLASATAGRIAHGTAWAVPLTAAACWAVLGGRSLRREATAVADLLAADDLVGARHRIRSLVGRDPSELSAGELARASVESVAENTSDAVVAPLFWGAVAGIPGLLTYRAVNTLDAMVGHRSPRYRNFGWAAARLDDLLNWLPARLTAALTLAVAPLVGGSPRAGLRAVRRDAAGHPSPNAGQVEAAFAGVLGVRLGGTNTYAGVADHRGTLGDGRPARPDDIARATRLAGLVGSAAAGSAVLAASVQPSVTRITTGGTMTACTSSWLTMIRPFAIRWPAPCNTPATR